MSKFVASFRLAAIHLKPAIEPTHTIARTSPDRSCAWLTAIHAAAANEAAFLLEDHFVGKQESGRAVIELHQQHPTPQVIHRTQNARPFAVSALAFVVSHGNEQTATPSNYRR
jgi:hypothetical protein